VSFAWYDILGTVGVAVIVAAYFLLQTGRLRSGQLAYSVMNGVGAVLISRCTTHLTSHPL